MEIVAHLTIIDRYSLRSGRLTALMSHVIFQCVIVSFYSAYFSYPPKWCTDSAVWLLHGCMVPRETAAVSVQVQSTPYNHTRAYSVTSFKAK